MREYRVRLAARDYSILLNDNNEAGEMVYADRALRINLLGKYDAIVDSIGEKKIDAETANLLVSVFLRDMRGYPSAEYSVMLFGEKKELNIFETKDGYIVYRAPKCCELSYSTAVLQDRVELTLCTASIAGKRIRIYEAQRIESVDKELLKRLKIVDGLPNAAYAIAVERSDGNVRFKCSESDVLPEAYLLPFLYYSLVTDDSVYDMVGKCKITLIEANKLLIPYSWY